MNWGRISTVLIFAALVLVYDVLENSVIKSVEFAIFLALLIKGVYNG